MTRNAKESKKNDLKTKKRRQSLGSGRRNRRNSWNRTSSSSAKKRARWKRNSSGCGISRGNCVPSNPNTKRFVPDSALSTITDRALNCGCCVLAIFSLENESIKEISATHFHLHFNFSRSKLANRTLHLIRCSVLVL